MALILGIDTGGTYTDGVIFDSLKKEVLLKGKALTTRPNLEIGIKDCILRLGNMDYSAIDYIALSTTLATNSIVESKGGRVGLILLGSNCNNEEYPSDMVYNIGGEMSIKGRQIKEIDEVLLATAIRLLKNHVDAVAISGFASIRNPEQELYVKKKISDALAVPIVCAHELTADLGYYERNVTAVLNAKLLSIIRDWLVAVKNVLNKLKIYVPIMIVKGDGSLMHEKLALERPVEIILSGPAASIIGGIYLTELKNGVILDMGGTTIDIAEIKNGRPEIDLGGASVGGWKTRVRAVKINTFGLGGDSWIKLFANGINAVGPERVMPFCVAGEIFPGFQSKLKSSMGQNTRELNNMFSFVYFIKYNKIRQYEECEEEIIRIVKEQICSVGWLLNHVEQIDVSKVIKSLLDDGTLGMIALTPTDLLHAEGSYVRWNTTCSKICIDLIAANLCISERRFIEEAKGRICSKINDCIPILDGYDYVAIGAPAEAWMGEVELRHNINILVPKHAEVANAIGAACGQIFESISALIRYDRKIAKYICYGLGKNEQFDTLFMAKEHTYAQLDKKIRELADRAGSRELEIIGDEQDLYTEKRVNGACVFIESFIRRSVVGKPKWEKDNSNRN